MTANENTAAPTRLTPPAGAEVGRADNREGSRLERGMGAARGCYALPVESRRPIRKRHVKRGSVALMPAGLWAGRGRTSMRRPEGETYPALRPDRHMRAIRNPAIAGNMGGAFWDRATLTLGYARRRVVPDMASRRHG